MCSQSYSTGAYDIVLATNVLHATGNMPNTLQNCKALLCKGGLLIANELTSKTDFLTLTFGLTDGWWLPHRHRHPHPWLAAHQQVGQDADTRTHQVTMHVPASMRKQNDGVLHKGSIAAVWPGTGGVPCWRARASRVWSRWARRPRLPRCCYGSQL